jgi:hypothetical protein
VIDLTWTATDVYFGLTPTAIRDTVTDKFSDSIIVSSGNTIVGRLSPKMARVMFQTWFVPF